MHLRTEWICSGFYSVESTRPNSAEDSSMKNRLARPSCAKAELRRLKHTHSLDYAVVPKRLLAFNPQFQLTVSVLN